MKLIRRSSLSKEIWSAIIEMIGGAATFFPRSYSTRMKKSAFIHENIRRTYRTYIPITGGINRPLVFVLHGRGGNSAGMILLTRQRFNRLADRDGFVVIYPDGIEMCWNDGRLDEEAGDRPQRENIDDTGFISDLTDMIVKSINVDKERVYVTGISNGATMAYRLACELSHKIAAIAPVDGNIPEMLFPECKPVLPVSVLAINNTNDPIVPYGGGIIYGSFRKVRLGKVLSADDSAGFWIEKNRCHEPPIVEELPDIDLNDGSRVERKQYLNKVSGDEVILYTINGGGHTWPGGLQYLPAGIIGKTCRDFDACEVIWDFFKRHSRKLQ